MAAGHSGSERLIQNVSDTAFMMVVSRVMHAVLPAPPP
jgi:hypothetical protein